MKKSTAIVWMLLSLAWLAGCGQVQVSLEQTATPNLAATATLANLQAQNAVLETRVADQARREELESALTLDADSEMIRLRILDSYTLWNTVWADGDVTWYPPQGSADPPQEFHQQVWIDQESQRFRVISASPGDRPAFVNVSNGKAILQMDLLSGQTQSQNMPAYAQEEYRPPRTLSDTVYPHPLTGLMSSPLGEMLLPSGLAQRQGAIFLPVRMENVAGQQALVTDFRLEDGTRTDRFWIDTRTGVVLRWQSYTQGEDETLASDRQINQIQYDRQAPDELFSPQIGEPPQFALDYSGEPIPQQATPTPQPGQEAQTPQAGEFYFTINDLQDQALSLVRLPGACLLGSIACPQPVAIPDYPNQGTTVHSLVWSPDGSAALLVVDAANSQETARLVRFDPEEARWTTLAEFQYLYDPVWSLDGSRIALRASQDGVEDIFLLRPDGSHLQNLTQGNYADNDGHFLSLSWLGERLLALHAEGAGNAANILYAFRSGGQETTALAYPLSTSTQLVLSPDQRTLLYRGSENGQDTVSVMQADGSNPRILARFRQGGVVHLGWSPDGQWIVFSVFRSNPPEVSADIYVIRPDGTDLRQVLSGLEVQSVLFAPDSSHLIVEGQDLPSGLLIYITSLDGSEVQLLQAPGLRLDTNWQGISWRVNR